ncbi:MAG: DUF4340 domain-containing protein [Lachnospiraceae bacterium]|nr:DUF4340 domain-containing protein [Lachnospiraceae bacterium]
MSKQKKNLLTLLGLFALLAVVLVLYFFVPRGEENDVQTADSDTEETITVDAIDSESIVSLSVEKDGEPLLALEKEGENWKFSGEKKIPLDEEAVTDLLSVFQTVEASGTLEYDSDRLSEYGLDNPSMSIYVTTSDNKKYLYDLGSQVPVKGGYYGLDSKEDAIYFMEESLYTSMDINPNSLIQQDELPEIEESYMTYLNVDNKKGDDFEAKVVSEQERVAAYSRWNITKPYDRPLATSTLEWGTTLGYFNTLTFNELVEYGTDNLKQYGLAQPASDITVTYYEAKKGYTPEADSSDTDTSADGASTEADSSEETPEIPEKYRKYKTLRLLIGDKKGEEYYVCLKGSNNVYTMSEAVVENMTQLDAYEAMDHTVYSTLATDIDGYDVTYGSTTMKITRTPVEESEDTSEDEKSEESGSDDTSLTNEHQNIWRLNGKKISAEDEEDFLTPYSSAYLLEFTAKAKDSVKPASKKPVLTFVYHEENRDVTVKYLPYDGTNFYRVDKDGMDYFLVDKRSVDDIITKFKGIERLG